MGTSLSQCSEADVSAFLARVIASSVFARAERQKRLLRYLVSATLAGKTKTLKGYTIGVEVFDRAPDFDPAIDAIVRVQAGQLRAKLREYYDGDGRTDSIRFELPKGNYSLRFERQAQGAPDAPMWQASSGLYSSAGGDAKLREAPTQERSAGRQHSLAELPFTNMSSDPEQEYFADGISEDLITDLSKLSGLFVIARHSAFAYKGVAKRVQDIARELGVRYLLEGSVRRSAGRVRITAQLMDGTSGNHLWAERFDRELSDLRASGRCDPQHRQRPGAASHPRRSPASCTGGHRECRGLRTLPSRKCNLRAVDAGRTRLRASVL